MRTEHITLFIVIVCGMIVSVSTGKLDKKAALAGGASALLIFEGAGFPGVIMMAAFFVLASAATSWKINLKQLRGLAETRKGRRNYGQVLANAGCPALLGLASLFYPGEGRFWQLTIAASLASATADTLSSELGNVYGKRFYQITSLRRGPRGENGVISAEGTLIGITGSCVIAGIYAAAYGRAADVLWIILGGTAGNLADSFLGATLERKGIIGNNAVNFLSTLMAALISASLSS